MSDRPRFTALGKAISFLLVIGLIALGAFMVMRGGMTGGPGTGPSSPARGVPSARTAHVSTPATAGHRGGAADP